MTKRALRLVDADEGAFWDDDSPVVGEDAPKAKPRAFDWRKGQRASVRR